MREVQITCPQCGHTSGYLEQEQSDFTSPSTMIIQVPWKCPVCSYPDCIWTKYGQQWQQQQGVIVTATGKFLDKDGNEIPFPPKVQEMKP